MIRPVSFTAATYSHPRVQKQQAQPRFGHHSHEHTAIQLWQILALGGGSLTVMALFARESIKNAVRKIPGFRKAEPNIKPESKPDTEK